MRIVFMGTPSYAATILENLIAQHEVAGVYTRPDAVRGRGRRLVASPVKQVAALQGIPVFTPRTLRDPAVQAEIASLAPDAICVAAYGAILPAEVLAIPPRGCLNVHASLLPHWRGAAPVERAILAGDEETGVCVMRMEEGLDTGDYCIMRQTAIGRKNAEELTAELAILGSQALLTALAHMEQGTLEWKKQDDFFATYAHKIEKGELNLAPTDKAKIAQRKVQASSPAHPARCKVASRSVAITRAEREPSRLLREKTKLVPGRAILYDRQLYLCMADQLLRIDGIHPDGKHEMTGADFARGVQNIKSGLITWEALDVQDH
ncbi:methionyl-tRNA formyltransferase [Curtanaerobium respiraculi]|jgi:methionyl-tRNA formyltransferase|uniref:methionyl-tRNA formyltransferase n=1 Tax=Curtanaerobium respiraculi TaxID=2949669 RepID=UPI0024B3C091|nr:methionyl-tRNA formyltransferase [Curtanaerobium respiraculi]